jgi:hypothetical protein
MFLAIGAAQHGHRGNDESCDQSPAHGCD